MKALKILLVLPVLLIVNQGCGVFHKSQLSHSRGEIKKETIEDKKEEIREEMASRSDRRIIEYEFTFAPNLLPDESHIDLLPLENYKPRVMPGGSGEPGFDSELMDKKLASLLRKTTSLRIRVEEEQKEVMSAREEKKTENKKEDFSEIQDNIQIEEKKKIRASEYPGMFGLWLGGLFLS